MNNAFVFPGQGSQYIGMGYDLYNSESIAKEVFDTVDHTLGYNLSDIIFHGPSDSLALTVHTQPAIMATSIAILRVIMHKSKRDITQLCHVVAGHSLGEYSALCASEAISFNSATRLLHLRASAMQCAVPQGTGAMAACIGIDRQHLQQIITNTIQEGICEIANDNVQGQIVVSGHKKNIEILVATLKMKQYKAILLNVSAPFHCSLMKPAEQAMHQALSQCDFTIPKTPIVSNVTANSTTDPHVIKQNLIAQICGTVRWRETLDKLALMGITNLVEIGPGNVLTNLAKRSNHNFRVWSISTIQDIDQFIAEAECYS